MSRTTAHLLLLLAALFWGLGNVAQKTVLDDVGPLTAVGSRCLVATLAIGPLLLLERRSEAGRGFMASAASVGLLFAASGKG